MHLRKGAIVLANTKLYSKQNHCSKLPRPIDISIFAENHNLHVPIYFGSEGAPMFAGNDFFQRIFPPSFPRHTIVVKALLAATMNSSCPSLLMLAVIGSIVPPTPGNVHSIVPVVALTTRILALVVLTPELHYRQCHPLHQQKLRFSMLFDMGNNFEDEDIDILILAHHKSRRTSPSSSSLIR